MFDKALSSVKSLYFKLIYIISLMKVYVYYLNSAMKIIKFI